MLLRLPLLQLSCSSLEEPKSNLWDYHESCGTSWKKKFLIYIHSYWIIQTAGKVCSQAGGKETIELPLDWTHVCHTLGECQCKRCVGEGVERRWFFTPTSSCFTFPLRKTILLLGGDLGSWILLYRFVSLQPWHVNMTSETYEKPLFLVFPIQVSLLVYVMFIWVPLLAFSAHRLHAGKQNTWIPVSVKFGAATTSQCFDVQKCSVMKFFTLKILTTFATFKKWDKTISEVVTKAGDTFVNWAVILA